ncbi:MAG: hypothetical protein QM817_40725 [Archangium sp.]
MQVDASVSPLLERRRFERAFARCTAIAVTALLAAPAFAQQMVGKSILDFGANYIIGPLGIFAVVIALAASVFRPDMVKGAIYAAIICAVLFFVIKMAPQLLTALRT